MSSPTPKDLVLAAVQSVSDALDADVILFNEPIDLSVAEYLEGLLSPQHENVFFILATLGGDAHAAYVIARDLQSRYKKVTVCIGGDCYSAGTLIVLGAHQLVISNRGRLGPLDAQILKKDEISERLSGLTVGIALDELHRKATDAVDMIARGLKWKSRGQLSFKTALEVAATMTAHMFGEIYKQIDPVKIGEDARSLQIAEHYGTMLSTQSQNVKEGTMRKLLKAYPSHECIIDRGEAKELFSNVRPPSDAEAELLTLLGAAATDAELEPSKEGVIIFPTQKQGSHNESNNRHKKDAGEAITTPSANPKSNGRSRRNPVPAGTSGSPGADSSPKESK